MASVKRYKISKDQLERVVESFVMESANIESKKAPVKNHIPSQSADAKKHVKNKMTGKMVEKGEGVPSAGTMKKKLSQAHDAKKHISKSSATHSNKAKVVKEEEIEEGWFGDMIGTSMNEKKAKEIFETRYKKHLSTLAKKFKTDEVTMKNALINAMVETGAESLVFAGPNALQWDAENEKFVKHGTKMGGPGGVVGG